MLGGVGRGCNLDGPHSIQPFSTDQSVPSRSNHFFFFFFFFSLDKCCVFRPEWPPLVFPARFSDFLTPKSVVWPADRAANCQPFQYHYSILELIVLPLYCTVCEHNIPPIPRPSSPFLSMIIFTPQPNLRVLSPRRPAKQCLHLQYAAREWNHHANHSLKADFHGTTIPTH